MKPLPKQFVEIWWLKPAWAFGGITTLVAILTALIPAQMFEQNWNTPKYFNQSTLLYIAASVICFVVGTFVTKSLTQPHRADQSETWDAQIPWGTALLLFRISSLLCLFGYLCWAASAISRGVTLRLLIDAMTGARGATYELRDNYLITISGITTMTQFGISAIVLGLPIGFARGWRKVALPLAAILGLSLFRAVVNSERLAAIELMVPVLVLLIHFWLPRHRKHSGWLRFAPILGAAGVWAIFTVCEYTRSWITFYQSGGSSLWQFASDRLLGYYLTASNNSAYLLRELDFPLGAPYFTMNFLWRFPLIGEFVQEVSRGLSLGGPEKYMQLLANGANPEFNNTGGILLPVLDFGVSFGLLFWLCAGAIAQSVYLSFVRGNAAGLCFYPAIFIGLLEIPRIFYWSDARFFPALAFLVLSAILLTGKTRSDLVTSWTTHMSTPS